MAAAACAFTEFFGIIVGDGQAMEVRQGLRRRTRRARTTKIAYQWFKGDFTLAMTDFTGGESGSHGE